jgi:hypothetical protein
VRVGRAVLVPHDALLAYVELLRSEAEASKQPTRLNVVSGGD